MNFPAAPLEDDITWVTRKALKACDLAPAQAARLANLDPTAVLAFTRGVFSREIALGLAPVLGLDPQAFADLPEYHPQIPAVAGLSRLEFSFHDGSVNAWLIRTAEHAILIDTGADPDACARRLDAAGVKSVDCFITHGHRDHTGGIGGLGARVARLFCPAPDSPRTAIDLTPGARVDCGPFDVQAIDLDGHCRGALGFAIGGLAVPLCAVGDALFAGSVGGTADPATHRRALDLIRRNVLFLPPDTLLLPGHGPATTVGQELRHNPFFVPAGTRQGL